MIINSYVSKGNLSWENQATDLETGKTISNIGILKHLSKS